MGKWTNGQVTLSLDDLVSIPLEEVSSCLDFDMELVTMIVLGVEQAPGSQIILSFDDENGRRLAAMLLHRPLETSPEWTEIEKSAVMETGNILGSAYLNELTRLIGRELKPSAPFFVQDFGASVLQQALVIQAESSENAMIGRTRFDFDNREVNWNVFFVPSNELIDELNELPQSL